MTSPERKVLGSFELLAPLGSGAMGEVYRARDTSLGREVAIKVLPDVFVQDEDRLARFEREARLLASLNHPNIASIHEIGQDGDTRFLVLELVAGETIEQKLKRGTLSADEAKGIFTQIASALESAHERGIVHRDLKPANVMLNDVGQVKLLDFGLARATEESLVQFTSDATEKTVTYSADSAAVTGEGRILGTPSYMAPEQANGRPVDKRADIWAFGCCLYEALSGDRPFVGETATDAALAVSSEGSAPSPARYRRGSLRTERDRFGRVLRTGRLGNYGSATHRPRKTAGHSRHRPAPGYGSDGRCIARWPVGRFE